MGPPRCRTCSPRVNGVPKGKGHGRHCIGEELALKGKALVLVCAQQGQEASRRAARTTAFPVGLRVSWVRPRAGRRDESCPTRPLSAPSSLPAGCPRGSILTRRSSRPSRPPPARPQTQGATAVPGAPTACFPFGNNPQSQTVTGSCLTTHNPLKYWFHKF